MFKDVMYYGDILLANKTGWKGWSKTYTVLVSILKCNIWYWMFQGSTRGESSRYEKNSEQTKQVCAYNLYFSSRRGTYLDDWVSTLLFVQGSGDSLLNVGTFSNVWAWIERMIQHKKYMIYFIYFVIL